MPRSMRRPFPRTRNLSSTGGISSTEKQSASSSERISASPRPTSHPWGICGNAVSTWIADPTANILYHYDAVDGTYKSDRNITLHADNDEARGLYVGSDEFDADAAVPIVSGGTGTGATISQITVDMQGRISSITWSSGGATYIEGDILTLTQGSFVYGHYTLQSADLSGGTILNLSNKSIQGYTYIWVLDSTASKIFAYRLEPGNQYGQRVPDKEQNLHADNTEPRGFASNGSHWWVSDANGHVYVYTVVGMSRVPVLELDLQSIAPAITGLWVDAENDALYVISYTGHVLEFATDGSHTVEREFNLDSQNDSPRDAWSNGITLWVVDEDLAYSYNLATGARGEQEPRIKNVNLYQGTVRSLRFNIETGQDYARFISEEKDFVIADEDVRVSLLSTRDADGGTRDVILRVVQDPLWKYRNQYVIGAAALINNVVQDFTLSDGSLELRFGTRNFGRRVTAGATMHISYVLTDGADAHSYIVNGEEVALPDPIPGRTYANISATVTSVLRSGFNELGVDVYRTVGPLAFAAQNVAIDFAGYRATALGYPGVIDCLPIRQAHYAPEVLEYTNVIKISLLAEDPNITARGVASEGSTIRRYVISDEYWDRFNRFLSERGISSVRYLRNDPVISPVDLRARVHTQITADETQVREAVIQALNKLFSARSGILGLSIRRSDIITAITRAASGILYVELDNPQEPVIHSRTQAVPVLSVETDTGIGAGTLPGGAATRYGYRYTVITRRRVYGGGTQDAPQYDYGESLPFVVAYDNNSSWPLTSDGQITLKFDKLPFGHAISLYRLALDGSGDLHPLGASTDAFDIALTAPIIHGGSGSGATISSFAVDGMNRITTITWSSGGAGYAAGDTITIIQGFVTAQYLLLAGDVSNGRLQNFTNKTIAGITKWSRNQLGELTFVDDSIPPSAFLTGTVPTVSGGAGSGATVNRVTIDNRGRISSVVWSNGGVGYAANDTLIFRQGAAYGTYTVTGNDINAQGTLMDLANKSISGVLRYTLGPPARAAVTARKANAGLYIDPDTNSAASIPVITGGSGNGAEVASIDVDNMGRITTITWRSGGTGYVAGDTITIHQGDINTEYELQSNDITNGTLQNFTGKMIVGNPVVARIAVSANPAGFDSTHIFYPQLIALDETRIRVIATNPALADSITTA